MACFVDVTGEFIIVCDISENVHSILFNSDLCGVESAHAYIGQVGRSVGCEIQKGDCYGPRFIFKAVGANDLDEKRISSRSGFSAIAASSLFLSVSTPYQIPRR